MQRGSYQVQVKFIPDLLKIDVEGAELSVLKGAEKVLRSEHPIILLSVHSDQLRKDCLEYLRIQGYTTFVPLNASQDEEATEFAIHC